jgi:hypothetical protein
MINLKKIIITAGFFALFSPAAALAQEKINNFDVSIKINQDASINISERVEYDFDGLQKHGIFRDIPIKYSARGGNFKLRISDISVTDENNNPYQFTKSFPGKNIQIKIGDADKLITGQKIYVINYKIKRAVNYFDTRDELYWNATGNQWPIQIEKSSAKIILPQAMTKGQIQSACFAGSFGGNASCDSLDYQYKDNDQIDAVTFKQSRPLPAAQGLTIVVGFPRGLIARPSGWQNIIDIARDNWLLVLPLVVFFIMFRLWWTRGRDPKGKGTIVAQYEAPDNLTPAQVGALIDEKVDQKDITSEIIYLATQGYLKIKRVENKGFIFKHEDYLLEKLKEPDNLTPHNKKLMEALFPYQTKTKNLSDLKNKFYKEVPDIKNKVYGSLILGGYFPEKPAKTQGKYIIIGSSILLGATLLAKLLGGAIGGLGIGSLIASGILVVVFGLAMPVKTKKGADAKEYTLGLKLYLEVAEKDRIKFHNAPAKNPEHFEKLLPYAMVLGVEKEWAEKFKDIYIQPPGWYSDPSGGPFNSIIFIGALNNFNHSSQDAIFSAPGGASSGRSGFGGGGFSGGGFGGGGGGSW